MKARRRFSPQAHAAIIGRQNGLCGCGCGEALGTDPRDIHMDHAVPLWLDGADDIENLRALKARHHMKKTAREARARAKMNRIRDRDGMKKPRMNAKDKALAKILENR